MSKRKWNWKVNMPCGFCNAGHEKHHFFPTAKGTAVDVVMVDVNGVFTGKFICEKCHKKKFKEQDKKDGK